MLALKVWEIARQSALSPCPTSFNHLCDIARLEGKVMPPVLSDVNAFPDTTGTQLG